MDGMRVSGRIARWLGDVEVFSSSLTCMLMQKKNGLWSPYCVFTLCTHQGREKHVQIGEVSSNYQTD